MPWKTLFPVATLFAFALAAVAHSQQPTPPPPASQQAQAPSASQSQESAAPSSHTPPPHHKRENMQAVAWSMLESSVNSDKSRDRSDAVSALVILNHNARAISLVEKTLDDKDAGIRFLSATSLGTMDARAAIPKLRDAMYDDSPQVSFASVQALWKMGDHSGRDLLYEILAGERKTAPGVIQSKMDKARKDLHDPKALALIGINEASGAFLGPFSMGVSLVEEYAKNTSAPVQARCAQMLTQDHTKETKIEMTEALSDKNWSVRAAAARALAILDYSSAVPVLHDMMDDDQENHAARLSAAAAILRLTERARPSNKPSSAPVGKPSGR